MKKKESNFDEPLSQFPNKKYKTFFEKFKEIDSLDISQWRAVHLLGYFCKKYKNIYNEEYSWKFNDQAPSKCFEVWQMNTLSSKLSSNPSILKEYIDWVFAKKVPLLARRFTSISILNKDQTLFEFKNILLNPKITRSTELPEKYKTIINQAGVQISTYGELSFISQMDSLSPELQEALTKLYDSGLDKSLLDKIL